MAKQNVKRLLPVRVRKSELSESKLSCPFPKKNGQKCTVLQKYRNLTDHCRHMHGKEISLRCAVEQCRWECHVSLRCLTSHRANLETHGVLVVSGGKDLDGTCKVVPYVEEEHGSLECHTAACAVTTLELTKYKANIKASFSNFRSQYDQLATKGQKDFDWAAFHALLKSNNMQISS